MRNGESLRWHLGRREILINQGSHSVNSIFVVTGFLVCFFLTTLWHLMALFQLARCERQRCQLTKLANKLNKLSFLKFLHYLWPVGRKPAEGWQKLNKTSFKWYWCGYLLWKLEEILKLILSCLIDGDILRQRIDCLIRINESINTCESPALFN